MTTRRTFLTILAASPVVLWLSSRTSFFQPENQISAATAEKKPAKTIRLYSAETKTYMNSEKVVKTEDEWRKILTPERFNILRKKGTERAFTGEYWNNEEKGLYKCAGCQNDLYSSDTKFDSGTGWPSFWAPIAKENVSTGTDNSFLMERTEVQCARCDGHLGHVFDDGPKPTGLRYCMNSAAMIFAKKA